MYKIDQTAFRGADTIGKFRRRFREIDRAFGNPAGYLLRRGHLYRRRQPSPASFDFSSSFCNSIAQIPRCFSTTTHKHLDHAPSGLERMAAQVRMGQVGAVCTREVFRLRETVASGNNSLRSAE